MSISYVHSLGTASGICAEIKQRISIPWLWQHHNLTGEPKPGGRCRSPFYEDQNPDFFISRDGAWFIDHGEPHHKGDVICFETLASRCTRGEAIRKLSELASLPQIRAMPAISRPQVRGSYHSERPRPITLNFLERSSADDLKQLAALRGFAPEALEMASVAGALWFATLRGYRAWIVTDKTRCIAEARRLDGKVWEHIGGAKAWTLPGGNKKWPLGILEAQDSRGIALVEGSADFISAYHLIWAENHRDVAPVAILGASISIHPVAVALFRGMRVRIFPHFDATRLNGFDSARIWDAQLRSVGAVVDCFDCSGMTMHDGQPVRDLNDLLLAGYDDLREAVLP